MEDKELRKLKRIELLEIISEQRKKIEELESKLSFANKELEARYIRVDLHSLGSREEARAFFNRVFLESQQEE